MNSSRSYVYKQVICVMKNLFFVNRLIYTILDNLAKIWYNTGVSGQKLTLILKHKLMCGDKGTCANCSTDDDNKPADPATPVVDPATEEATPTEGAEATPEAAPEAEKPAEDAK